MERYDGEDDVREIGAPNDSNDIGLFGRSDRFPVFVAFFRPPAAPFEKKWEANRAEFISLNFRFPRGEFMGRR